MVKTKIFILYTGGTIGMAPKEKGNPASPLEPKSLEELKTYMPGLDKLRKEYGIEVNEHSFEKPVDSSDIKPKDWIEIAEEIYKVYNDYDGFIVLHGTDTMAYTSSALSFMLENLAKPVVITGSQLPISNARTDAIMNFMNAIYIAGYKAFNLPRVPEVIICFADKIVRGCRATKVSSTQWAGFDSPNFPLLGRIGETINIDKNLIMPIPNNDEKRFFIKTNLVDKVMNIGIFPGFKAEHLEKLLEDKDIEGVVINTFGAGNAPSDEDFLDVIKQAIDKGKIVINTTQCVEGMVQMGLYEASSNLLERGVISGLDMTTEAALTKLMLTLGTKSGDDRLFQLQINQRGEQSENLFDLRYGGVKRASAQLKKSSSNVHSASIDKRLRRDKLSRAIVRISHLGIIGAKNGEEVELNIFMNMPRADSRTSKDEPRCVATLHFEWEGEPKTHIQIITDKTKDVMGEGDIILSVVSPNENIKFYYKGLYLALFSKA